MDPPHRSWRWHLAEWQVAGSSLGQVPQILWMIEGTVPHSDPNEEEGQPGRIEIDMLLVVMS
jgi:hypothetical protein